HCNPDIQSISATFNGFKKTLPFSLETTSVASLEEKLNSGTLTAPQLVQAELNRIALTNTQGPAIQAVRNLNPNAINEAVASEKKRKIAKNGGPPVGPLAGIPVLVNDTIGEQGVPTSGGSIPLEDHIPGGDSTIVAKLKAAGAIVLGDTNTTELGGFFDPNMPQGYSSLGGQ